MDLDLENQTRAGLVAFTGVVAVVLFVLAWTLPFDLSWQESAVFAGIFFLLGVIELALDDTSF